MQIVDDRGLREDSNEYTFVARDFSLGLQDGMRVFIVAEKSVSQGMTWILALPFPFSLSFDSPCVLRWFSAIRIENEQCISS